MVDKWNFAYVCLHVLQRSLATDLQNLSMELRKKQSTYLKRLRQQKDVCKIFSNFIHSMDNIILLMVLTCNEHFYFIFCLDKYCLIYSAVCSWRSIYKEKNHIAYAFYIPYILLWSVLFFLIGNKVRSYVLKILVFAL